MAVASDPVGRKGKIIPIMVEKGDIPFFARRFSYLDVSSADFQGKLLVALERQLPDLESRGN